MTDFVVGKESIAAAKIGATWDTPVLCTIGDGFEFLSESVSTDSQYVENDQIQGQPQKVVGTSGNKFYGGDVPMIMMYEGLEKFIANAMGIGATPSQVSTDDAYLHTFRISVPSAKVGKFLTLIFEKGPEVWEYASEKTNSFTFDVTGSDQRLEFGMNVIASSLARNLTGVGTNNATTIGAITLPTNRDIVKFSQATCSVNAQGGADFASSTDLVYINEFHCEMTNNYPTDDVTSRGGSLIDEPLQDDWSVVTGSLVFSKFHNEVPGGNMALLTAADAKTPQKMKMSFVGPIADGTTNFQLDLWFPLVIFNSDGAPIEGPGRVGTTLDFESFKAASDPTGFPTGASLFTIELTNQNAVSALA